MLADNESNTEEDVDISSSFIVSRSCEILFDNLNTGIILFFHIKLTAPTYKIRLLSVAFYVTLSLHVIVLRGNQRPSVHELHINCSATFMWRLWNMRSTTARLLIYTEKMIYRKVDLSIERPSLRSVLNNGQWYLDKK